MESSRRSLLFMSVVLMVLWWCSALALQRPPPRYSQQYMPETSFTCRNKIVGSYYADPETDCQLFHVCVSVAGSIQDYKFLCPNDTAFDQESQTCADWYDVDCEAATLYYASDNFDLYRIGSGLESPHYDSIRSDAEPQDHLQRSESNDPVRSSANALNRVSSTAYNSNNNNNNNNNSNRDVLRGNSGNFYSGKNNKDDFDNEKSFREEPEIKKKTGVRKVSRKQPTNSNVNNYPSSSTAVPPVSNNQNTYTGHYYSGNVYNQRATAFVTSTTARPSSQDNYSRSQNTQRYSPVSSTYRPNTNYQDTYSSYQTPSSTSRTTLYNAYSVNTNYNQQNSDAYTQSSTLRSTNYNNNNNNYQTYNGGQYIQSSTVLPSTNYQANDYTNYQQRNYNNIQRGNGNNNNNNNNNNNIAYQSSTAASTVYENNYGNNNGQHRNGASTTRSDATQATAKYFSNYAGSSYPPTTYSPATKKYVSTDNSAAQTSIRSSDRYNSQSPPENNQYYDKTSQGIKASTQYYDSTKSPKKATQYNNYDTSSGGKYYTETSTSSYDFGRASVGIGFSPASINHLAETPRSTTPVPRRQSGATTYNPSSFNSNTQKPSQLQTTSRESTYVSGSARPFSSTTRFASSTTVRPKSGKKNDYDYAYYDNAGTLEYDGLELEHVSGNKESSKLSRN